MSKQTKEQFQKAANGLTNFLEAFAELNESQHKTTMRKEILPLLKEPFKEKHQKIIPDLERLLRISMNQENYYSYSLRQALRRLERSELSRFKKIVNIATNDVARRNGECNLIWEEENGKVHQVNSILMDELDFRVQDVSKQPTPNPDK